MDFQNIKVLIIDDSKRARDILSALPEYFDATILKYADTKEYLKTESNRAGVKLLIMDSDETRALEIYKYLREDPEKYMLRRIPVVLLTKDEFSDNTLEFYDLGEPYFYEGELDDADFYMLVTQAVEDGELLDDKDLYPELFVQEDKPKPSKFSPEKVMGSSFEVHVGDDAPSRVVSYGNKQIIEKISRIVKHNKEEAVRIWDIIEQAAKEKAEQGEEVDYIPRRERKKTVNKVYKAEESPAKAIAKPIQKQKQYSKMSYQMPARARENRQNMVQSNNVQMNMNGQGTMQPNMMNGKMMQNNMMQNAPSNVMKRNNYTQGTVKEDPNRKKKILIVDSDQRTLKAFQLFIGDSMEIVLFESGMKVIDYFSKNTADMVIVEYDMPGLPGMSILKSIWMQPYGRNMKAAIMMSADKSENEKLNILKTPGITGVIDKPIVKKQLLSVINRAI